MALTKVQADGVNLGDNFAFTGTVTGASEGLVHLETQTGTNVASVKFGNDVININNYKKYYVIGRTLPATDGATQRLRFMDASENDISITNAYRGSVNSGTTANSTFIDLSGSAGSVANIESGAIFYSHIDIEHLGNADFQSIVSTRLTFINTSSNWSYKLSDYGYRFGNSSVVPAGFHFYLSSGNYARVRISVFGVTESS